jgi:hypothetical protein
MIRLRKTELDTHKDILKRVTFHIRHWYSTVHRRLLCTVYLIFHTKCKIEGPGLIQYTVQNRYFMQSSPLGGVHWPTKITASGTIQTYFILIYSNSKE